PASGERWIGPSIELGTLAQEHHPALGAATPIEAVRLQRPCTEGEAVHALMRFLFTYEQVRQPVEKLSGGERTRLELLLLERRDIARRRVRRERQVAAGVTLGCVVVVGAFFALSQGGSATGTSAAEHGSATAAPPPQEPRGGRTLLPDYRVVAYYGAPQDPG